MPGGEPNRVVYMNTCWLCKSAIEAVAPSACLCVGESVGDCGLWTVPCAGASCRVSCDVPRADVFHPE